MKHPPPSYKDLMKCTCDESGAMECPLTEPQYVWMIEVSRGINVNRLTYIVHAKTENDALRIISKDITFEALLKLPGEARIKFRVLGVPIVDSEWGENYLLI